MRDRAAFLKLVLDLARKREAGRTVLDDDWLFAAIDTEVEQHGRDVLAGLTGPEIRRKHRWSERRAHRIEMRWRRYLKALATTRAGTGIVRTDPSRTVDQHFFWTPGGQRLFYFEHHGTETIQ